MIIEGRHIQGMGGANRSIKRQKKFFEKLGLPGVEAVFNGTINLSTAPRKYKICRFDYFFPSVQYKFFPRKRTEDFGFISITRLIYNSETFHNWGYIYVPHSSPHFGNEQMFELIGRRIENFKPGDEISVEVADAAMEEIP